MELNEGKLQNLLYEKKRHIKSKDMVISMLLSLISYVSALLVSDISNLSKTKLFLIILISILYFVILLISIKGFNYSAEQLYKDICSTSKVHDFSLFVIKNSHAQYLLKKDSRWKTYLFPYKRTSVNDDSDDAVLFLKEAMNISSAAIISKKETDITKRSVSQNISKTYHHIFYQISAENIPVSKSFKINGCTYKWYSIDDMKNDKKIMLNNSETVEFIEKNF